jgi:hypothetical protein
MNDLALLSSPAFALANLSTRRIAKQGRQWRAVPHRRVPVRDFITAVEKGACASAAKR